MRLDEIINYKHVIDVRNGNIQIEVAGVAENLDDVIPGSLFFCVSGGHVDGHELAQEALLRGAVALVVAHALDLDVPQLVVSNVRAQIGPAAAKFYGNPGDSLALFAITGTNGKTTTATMLAEILRATGRKVGVIGTLTSRYTSPPPIVLQQLLKQFKDDAYDTVVMEASSHALAQHRLDPLRFEVGVFTNLTQDHLDYHKTMEAYFAAKSLLFTKQRIKRAVINIDDAYGKRLADVVEVPCTTVSRRDVGDLHWNLHGAHLLWKNVAIDIPVVGEFNVANALCAATAAHAFGIDLPTIARALSGLEQVPGRMERIDEGQPFRVIVDFAHTPDGLQNVLAVAKQSSLQTQGRLICVFGCGGDRDADKRPIMGAVASTHADLIILTNDNPRSENPEDIIHAIRAGISESADIVVQPDRKEAITYALHVAKPTDVVVIAGKGHETTQQYADEVRHFDDREVARTILQTRRKAEVSVS